MKTRYKVAGIVLTIGILVLFGYFGISKYFVSKLPAPLPLVGVRALTFFSPWCSSEDGSYVFPLTDNLRTQYDVLVQNAEAVSVEGPIHLSGKQIILDPLCDGTVLVRYPAPTENVSRIVKIEKVKGGFKYKTPY